MRSYNTSMTEPMRKLESADRSARDAWFASHGNLRQIAYTELVVRQSELIIVSTVLVARGISMLDGFFWTYESRVFGADFDRSDPIVHIRECAEEDHREAIKGHASLVGTIADSTLKR
jgi:hypothetical protein